MENIQFADFLKVDIRVGTIVRASDFPEAGKPTYENGNIVLLEPTTKVPNSGKLH